MAEIKEARVPDIGDSDAVPVIEVLISAGDHVDKDQGMVTLESAKATIEVPAPFAGTVKEVKVKEGDEIAEGALIAMIEAAGDGDGDGEGEGEGASDDDSETTADADADSDDDGSKAASADDSEKSASKAAADKQASASNKDDESSGDADADAVHPPSQPVPPREEDSGRPHTPPVPANAVAMPGDAPYASPAVRAFARELGVDIVQVKGSGRKGRIQREDVQAYVKHALASGARPAPVSGTAGGLELLPWPEVDFAKFGEIEEQSLSRIKKISGANLARNWAMIPHVTQHDDADITEQEAFRKQLGKEYPDVKISPLVFQIKAVVAALQAFPQFNASLDASGEHLIVKKYFHIGIAVDTSDGLVVPVIRDADQKGLLDLARELGELSGKARDKKLGPADMSGGCFSISSLGGIGGTSFTPIVNAPEVAILGVSRSVMKPVWNGEDFAPRLMLPLSLSYDHRVIDGAAAARFTVFLAKALGDIRRLLL